MIYSTPKFQLTIKNILKEIRRYYSFVVFEYVHCFSFGFVCLFFVGIFLLFFLFLFCFCLFVSLFCFVFVCLFV